MGGLGVRFTDHGFGLRKKPIHGEYNDPEKIVADVLEDDFGFNTINISPGGLPRNEIDDRLRLIDEVEKIYYRSKFSRGSYEERHGRELDIYEKGVPDLLVWKMDKKDVYHDIGFIEVKDLNDSIQTSQAKWFVKHPMFKTAIAEIYEKTEEV